MSTQDHPVSNPKSCGSCEHGHDDTQLPQGALVIASGILTGIGLILHWTHAGPDWLTIAAFAAATLAGGALVFPAALGALRKFRLDMNVLMTVAVAGAWIIGEHAEAAAVVFLFALSELLESWAATRARRAVDALLELSPSTAIVRLPDGTERKSPSRRLPSEPKSAIKQRQPRSTRWRGDFGKLQPSIRPPSPASPFPWKKRRAIPSTPERSMARVRSSSA
jgi:Cd2+/Zn2+-exporting ATPase